MAFSVDQQLFTRLYRQGCPRKVIAEKCGCSPSHVSSLAKRLGLPALRKKVEGKADDPSAKPLAHPILATKGSYAALALYAADHGLSIIGAQQLWHKWRRG